jgi:ABC-type nitrate/sulfonate/bicarbonate transport system substrate-binding protein
LVITLFLIEEGIKVRPSSKLVRSLAAALTVAALAACSSHSSSTAARTPPEVRSITIDMVPTADAAGIYTAQDNGYFAQQGADRQDRADQRRRVRDG